MAMLGSDQIPLRDRAAWDARWILAHLAGEDRAERWLPGWRDAVRARIDASLAASGPGRLHPVDRREGLTPRELQREYIRPCLPVVLAGAARDWPAVQEWTPSWLAERFGDEEVILIAAAADDARRLRDADYQPDAGTATLADIARAIETGGDLYARFIPLLAKRPDLVAQAFDMDLVRRLRPRGAAGTYCQLFMGGAGTTTAIHNAIGSNLFVQVWGEKTWWLYPPTYNAIFNPPLTRSPFFMSQVDPERPDADAHPLWDRVSGYKVTLRPGDILYNPPFYWHYVRNPTASIGVGVRWYDAPSILRTSATQALLTLLATNPPVRTARGLRHDFTRIFVSTRR